MNGELNAMLEKMERLEELPSKCGKKTAFTKYGDKEIYITESGVGEIFSAAATQHLISYYGVEAIMLTTGDNKLCHI